jgi:stage II sporulation protein D
MFNKKGWKFIATLVVLTFSLLIASCAAERRPEQKPGEMQQQGIRQSPDKTRDEKQKGAEKPQLPEPIRTQDNKEPSLKVYIVQENKAREMPFEEYVAGVVAGEIKNDWPEESIKAQAIIARTFVLQFIEEKGQSKYENAHNQHPQSDAAYSQTILLLLTMLFHLSEHLYIPF